MDAPSISTDKLPSEDSFHKNESLVRVSETEKEVEDESYDDYQPKIEVLVQLGKEDPRPFTLSDCYSTDRPGMHLEILPKIIFDPVDEDTDIEEVDLPKPIFRLTVDTGTLASIKCKTNEAQTLKRSLVNAWSQYEPRAYTDEEIKETLDSPSFKNFTANAEKSVLGSLIQNSIADSFFWDLSSLHDETFYLQEEKESQLMINGSFSCSNNKDGDKLISCIHWHPIRKDIFVASTIGCSSFEKRTKKLLQSPCVSESFYVWSVRNQFFSKMTLESLDDAYVLKFNPKMPNLIAAGTVTGQLVLWDVRPRDFSVNDDHNIYSSDNTTPAAIQYCVASNMDHIHKHGITDLHWVLWDLEIAAKGEISKNPSNGYQIMTCGLDGFIQVWDLRMGFYIKSGQTGPRRFHHLDGIWEPFHSIEVLASEGRKRKSLTCFVLRNEEKIQSKEIVDESDANEDEQEVNPYENTEFYGGCDDGQVLCGSFKLMKDDSGKFVAKRPEFYNSPHGASVTALSCSPFIKDMFFSTGGRNIAIWQHSIKTQPIFLRERHTYITTGQWSPTRPALFVLGYKDGSIEIWDLLHNLYEPYLVHFVSTSAVRSLSIQPITATEHIIACGDSKGVVCTMYLLPDLYIPKENEIEKFKQLTDKEAKRILEKSTKLPEQNIPQKIQSKDQVAQLPGAATTDSKEEEAMRDSYDEFLKLQNKQLKYLNGLKGNEKIEVLKY